MSSSLPTNVTKLECLSPVQEKISSICCVCPNVILFHFAVGFSLLYNTEPPKSCGCNIRSEYVQKLHYMTLCKPIDVSIELS